MASPTPADLVEELKALVAAHVAGSVELAARLNALVRTVAADPPPAPADGGAVVTRLAEAGLASYAELSKHTLALLGGLVGVAERVMAPGGSPAGAGEGGAAGTPGTGAADLRLEGRAGERVTAAFLVENTYEQAVDVAFKADDLVADGHADVPGSIVTFEPSRLSILPQGSAVATAVVELTPAFTAGATYASTVRLLGFEGRSLRLALTVVPGQARRTPTPRPAAASAPARARRPKLRQAGGSAR